MRFLSSGPLDSLIKTPQTDAIGIQELALLLSNEWWSVMMVCESQSGGELPGLESLQHL